MKGIEAKFNFMPDEADPEGSCLVHFKARFEAGPPFYGALVEFLFPVFATQIVRTLDEKLANSSIY